MAIRRPIALEYAQKDAESLCELMRWASAQMKELSFREQEQLLEETFDGQWMYFRLLYERLQHPTVEMSRSEGNRLRDLIGRLLAHAGLSWGSEIGLKAAPLLRDLSNAEVLDSAQR